MSHFLARLVERTRGRLPHVEPLVAPRFAPATIAEIATEVDAPPPMTSPEKETASPKESTARDFVRRKTGPRPADENSREATAAAAPEPEPLLVPEEILVSPPPTTIVRRIASEDIPAVEEANGAKAKPSIGQQPATRPGSAPPAPTPPVTGNVDPGQPTAGRAWRRPAIRPNEPSGEPPIVRVTIGRIEVRAETPSAAPPRKMPRSPGPELTLDRYLRERKEGRR
jgi:hypothetical protein